MKRFPKQFVRAAKAGSSLLATLAISLAISGCLSQPISQTSNISEGDSQRIFAAEGKIDNSLSSRSFDMQKYSPAILDWDNLQLESHSISAFTLMKDGFANPTIPQQTIDDLQKSIADLEIDDADLGFCIIDLESGKGIAYNVDTRIYGASSIKAHAVVFACQEQVKTGRMPFEYFSDYAYSTITESNDDAYLEVRSITGGHSQTMYEWLDKMNLDHYLADDTDYPHYTVRDSAKLWTNAYLFLQEGSEEAQQVRDMMGSTSTSFLRDGVIQNPDDDSVTVLNKAGWIADFDEGYYAVVDAGIVIENGHPYMISVMSGAFDSDENRQKVSNLCSALWGARGCLA